MKAIYDILKRGDTEATPQKADDDRLEGLIKEHTQQLHLLQSVNNAINTGASLDEILAIVTEGVRKIFNYSACDVFLLDREKNRLILESVSVNSKIIERVEKLTGLTVEGHEIPLFEGSHFHEFITHKRAMILNDPEEFFKDYTDNKILKRLAGKVAKITGFEFGIGVPLVAGDEVFGFLGVGGRGNPGKDDIEELDKFVTQLALAIKKKQTEETLRESEERYRSLIENARDAIFTISPDGTFESLNPAFEDITGWSHDELIGKHFVPIIHPDDAALAKDIFRRALGGGYPPTHELHILSKSGEELIGELKIAPQIVNGESVGVLGIGRDVTVRRRAQEEMKKRLMKFDLEEGELYLVKEPTSMLSIEAFEDLLNVGYPGQLISRMSEEESKKALDHIFEFLWLSESEGEKTQSPKLADIETVINTLPRRRAVLIDRLDYLIFKNGFEETVHFIQRLREIAYLSRHVIILSIDPSTLSTQELRLLEKEALEVKPRHKIDLPEDMLEILKFVYEQNSKGIKPSYTDIRKKQKMSKPTVGKKIKQLAAYGYLAETKKGMYKVVSLTKKGQNLF